MPQPELYPLFDILKSPNFKQRWENRHLPKKKKNTTQYHEPRGSDVAKAKGPMKKHAFEFFLFPMKPIFTTVVITAFTSDANGRSYS